MPRRRAQQRMTLSDLEWPFHASRAISTAAELLVGFVGSVQTLLSTYEISTSFHTVDVVHLLIANTDIKPQSILTLSLPIPFRLYTLPHWSNPPFFNFWHSGARMSKIKNGGLDQYGAGPLEQQQFGTAGVKMVNIGEKYNFTVTGRCQIARFTVQRPVVVSSVTFPLTCRNFSHRKLPPAG